MASVTSAKRSDSIRIRLSPDMLERFELLAKAYGMAPATLGSFAIARFCQQEELNSSLARSAVSNMVESLSKSEEAGKASDDLRHAPEADE